MPIPDPVQSPESYCNSFRFAHNVNCAPGPYSYRGDKKFPKVAIIGGGITGLTCAVELTEMYKHMNNINGNLSSNPGINIYESASYWGGKMSSSNNPNPPNGQHPIEHSTRIYPICYISLFDILEKVGILKTALKSMGEEIIDGSSFISYNNGAVSINSKNRWAKNISYAIKQISLDTTIEHFIDIMNHFNLSDTDARKIYRKIFNWIKASEPDKQNMTIGKTFAEYMEWGELSENSRNFLQSLVGIIVAARIQCDAYVILHLLEVFIAVKTTKKYKENLYPNIKGANCSTGPTSIVIIQPIVDYLVNNKINHNTNTRITKIDMENVGKYRIGTGPGSNITFILDEIDIIIFCTPHMVTQKLLLQDINNEKVNVYMPNSLMLNAWSFGIQVYFTKSDIKNLKLIQPMEDHTERTYQALINSPWEIIYQILYSTSGVGDKDLNIDQKEVLWDIDKPFSNFGKKDGEDILAVATITMSNQYRLGLKNKKTFLNCTPSELIQEVLFQIGIDIDQNSSLIKGSSFGSILYLDSNATDPNVLMKDYPEWLVGPIQPNGYYWASNYTLYIKQPSNTVFGCKGVCAFDSYRDNLGCYDLSVISNKENTIGSIASWHNLGMSVSAGGGVKPGSDLILPSTTKILPQGIYIAGEYCDTFYKGYGGMQVPTMEKACESAKIACQKISEDYQLGTEEVKGLEFNKLETYAKEANLFQKMGAFFKVGSIIMEPVSYASILFLVILIIALLTFLILLAVKGYRLQNKNQKPPNDQRYSGK